MSYGPPTDPEVRARYRAELAEAQAKIDAAVAKCRYCKTAKTAARKRVALSRAKNGPHSAYADTAEADRAVDRAICQAHRRQYHLTYVTSPASETYWTS